jgi:hypothetical protein
MSHPRYNTPRSSPGRTVERRMCLTRRCPRRCRRKLLLSGPRNLHSSCSCFRDGRRHRGRSIRCNSPGRTLPGRRRRGIVVAVPSDLGSNHDARHAVAHRAGSPRGPASVSVDDVDARVALTACVAAERTAGACSLALPAVACLPRQAVCAREPVGPAGLDRGWILAVAARVAASCAVARAAGGTAPDARATRALHLAGVEHRVAGDAG